MHPIFKKKNTVRTCVLNYKIIDEKSDFNFDKLRKLKQIQPRKRALRVFVYVKSMIH